MANRQVNLTKRVQTPRGMRYCPVVIAANGRIKPEVVIVNGTEERHPEGSYYLEWREGSRRVRLSVGKDAQDAATRRLRKEAELNAINNGVAVVPENGNGQRSLAARVADYLDEVKLTKKPKTLAAYTTALEYFTESCRKMNLDEIERADLLKFSAFLRDEKEQAPRSVHNKFENVMTFLKSQGVRGLVDKNDWPRFVEEEPEVYEREELNQLFRACTVEERLWYEFFLMTGMREQEVMHCAWADLNLTRNTVTVRYKPEYGFSPKNYRGVQKTTGSSAVSYIYDVNGKQVSEVNSSGGWNRGEVYASGRRLATYALSTTYFPLVDWLGTTRMMTNVSGNSIETCQNLPFGDGRSCSGPDDSPVHLTGQIFDNESGLDYFFARQYTSTQAHWASPDPAGLAAVNPANPQSWNRYAYVENRPLSARDPLGLRPIENEVSCGWDSCSIFGWGTNLGGGGSIMGNDIFDAIMGAPGTYSGFDMYGNFVWGFSIDKWFADEAAIEADMAANDPRNTPEVEAQCLQAVIGAVNAAFGQGTVSTTDVLGAFIWGGAWNFNFTVTGNAAAQVTRGRFDLTGAGPTGPSLHVPSNPFWDPDALWLFNSDAQTLTFTAHIDSDNGNSFPRGTLSHFVNDVLGNGSRNPCPSTN